MYNILKFKKEDVDKHYFCSDLHNYHNPNWPVPIWKGRGYSNHTEQPNDAINKINAKVGVDDYLWMLGDGFLNSTDELVERWFDRIVCRNIYYLFGNHESSPYRIYKNQVKELYGEDDIEVYPLRWKNVVFIGNHVEVFFGRRRVIMNHFPLRIWHKNHRAAWCLSGHSHLNDWGRSPDCPDSKSMDLGWDYKNDIWSFKEIEEIMNKKGIELFDHHNKNCD